MIDSKAAIDLPVVFACTVICAQTLNAFWSNAKIRSSNPTSNRSSHSVNADLRLDFMSLATPRCHPPQVIALTQSSWGLRPKVV